MTWVLLQVIQLFKPTVSLKWESQENTQVPHMEEEASWKWQLWEQENSQHPVLWALRCLNKLAGNSGRPTIPLQCWKRGQFIRDWTVFLSKCFLPFVTWQLSSLQGCSVTQRPGLHPSSWQDLPARRQVGALGCCGRSQWAHPSLKLSQWWCRTRITKHWDKSPGERGESLWSVVFKTQLTKS